MPVELSNVLKNAAWAFRGYNVTNLGRTPELLSHPAYGETVKATLHEASEAASETLGRKIDLIARVRQKKETTLRTFAHAVPLIIGVEVAQMRLLKEFFGIEYAQAKTSFGYSLGEVTALVCDGILSMKSAISIPLPMADDCAHLGSDVHMGIVFSRGDALDLDKIRTTCVEINQEGKGVIGISSYLSPNSILVLGQRRTVHHFRKIIHSRGKQKRHVRVNRHHWPPLHTPIVWEKNIPNRAGVLMHTIEGSMRRPNPPILSLVTGAASYNEYNAREILNRWVDHPQRVWDVVNEVFGMGIKTIIHVGPEPNLFPATFKRLADNVQAQMSSGGASGLGMRVVAGMARRPWLTALLPERTALARAPFLQQVILEDWLLEQKVA